MCGIFSVRVMSSAILNCRFYRAKFPAIDELVMVTIKQIEDMGAYVQLLEYNNIEGNLPPLFSVPK